MYASVVAFMRGYEARIPGTNGEMRRMGRDATEAMYSPVAGTDSSYVGYIASAYAGEGRLCVA